jgi:hypothetical protein
MAGQGEARARNGALLAKILRFCLFCGRETPHEVRGTLDQPLVVCVHCRERSQLDELDRD